MFNSGYGDNMLKRYGRRVKVINNGVDGKRGAILRRSPHKIACKGELK